MLVYKITNIKNNLAYVGVTHGSHFHRYWGSGIHIKRAIKKHGKSHFVKRILEHVKDEQSAFERERHWIRALNTLHPNGYNLSAGGDGIWNPCPLTIERMRKANMGENNPQFGKRTPDSVRKKLSDALKGRAPWNKGIKLSADIRNNMSKAMTGSGNSFYGRTHTPEARQKMSEFRKKCIGEKHFRYGKKLTDEHKQKISIAQRKRFEYAN